MIEITLDMLIGGLVTSFGLGAVTSYVIGKYRSPDLDCDGKVEAEEIKTIIEDAMETFTAYKDAIDDIVEDADLTAEEAVDYIKNINKVFGK